MKPYRDGHTYDLRQLGGGLQELVISNHLQMQALVQICADRTRYLDAVGNGVLACTETKDAYTYLDMALKLLAQDLRGKSFAKIETVDEGHIYEIHLSGHNPQRVTFVKRSGENIRHKEEWPGVQTQEVMRAVIHYIKKNYQRSSAPEIANLLRMSLFMYEVRAYRRKQESVNRKAPAHDDTARPKDWHLYPFPDVPFNSDKIEMRAIGPDGHIIVL